MIKTRLCDNVHKCDLGAHWSYCSTREMWKTLTFHKVIQETNMLYLYSYIPHYVSSEWPSFNSCHLGSANVSPYPRGNLALLVVWPAQTPNRTSYSGYKSVRINYVMFSIFKFDLNFKLYCTLWTTQPTPQSSMLNSNGGKCDRKELRNEKITTIIITMVTRLTAHTCRNVRRSMWGWCEARPS